MGNILSGNKVFLNIVSIAMELGTRSSRTCAPLTFHLLLYVTCPSVDCSVKKWIGVAIQLKLREVMN